MNYTDSFPGIVPVSPDYDIPQLSLPSPRFSHQSQLYLDDYVNDKMEVDMGSSLHLEWPSPFTTEGVQVLQPQTIRGSQQQALGAGSGNLADVSVGAFNPGEAGAARQLYHGGPVGIEMARRTANQCEAVIDGQRCTRRFRRIEHLRRHMRTHESGDPLICVFKNQRRCGKRFQRFDNFIQHLKTHVGRNETGLYLGWAAADEEYWETQSPPRRTSSRQNERVPWEQFVSIVQGVFEKGQSQKIIDGVCQACTKDDEKTREAVQPRSSFE